ncbi:MAG TPA: dual specificity protein phosphatase [Nitrospiraceae bacterium]|nr:dual specificity protein phosphatase [Nitrospiraceae bacterium]
MHMINKRLIVGNIEDATHPPVQIGALLLVAEEQDVTAPSWLKYAKVPLKEFCEPPASALCEAVDWIESHIGDDRIMVCCRAGMGRSVSVVIAYLCCVENLTYENAVKLVLTRRPGGVPLPKLEETVEKVLNTRRGRACKASGQVDPVTPPSPTSTP